MTTTASAGRSFSPSQDPPLRWSSRKGGTSMKNPLDSLWGTFISGLVLTAILYFVVKSILASAGA